MVLKPIVCIAFPAWEGNYLKSTVQLMTELARLGHPVLYVDYAYTWKDFVQSVRGKGFATWRRMLGLEPRLRTILLENGANIHVLTLPPIFPINFLKSPKIYDTVNSVNVFFIKKCILNAMHTLGMVSPTVVNAFNPSIGNLLANELHESKLIYYCYDDIGAATWANRHGERLEQAFLKKADTVIVTSQGLLNKKSVHNARCFLIKNGVDYDLFSQKSDKKLPFYFEKNKKIIGYLGSVDERLDYDLLEKLISETPQYQYIFVGRVTKTTYEKRLQAFPNVALLGSQPPTSLPAWVQNFDVCLIPFVKNELTKGIYPLKINEYLAAGKPVVTTRFADLSDFETVVSIADDNDAFIKLVQTNFLETDTTQLKHFAVQNSWTERGQQFSNLV